MKTIENSNRTNDNSTRRKRIFISFVLVVLLAMIGTATAVMAQSTQNATGTASTTVRDGNVNSTVPVYNASTIKDAFTPTANYTRAANSTNTYQYNYMVNGNATDDRYIYKWANWSAQSQAKANINITSKINIKEKEEDAAAADGDDGSGSGDGTTYEDDEDGGTGDDSSATGIGGE